ncbi:MAG: hypothetical protein EXR48_07435 [Dehalococcoidia bacterium]|nr:hypothetical protein [Dehalococcoidia bacterium]
MSKWWLIGGGVALLALLAAAIGVALVERETTLTEGTPEAAVQRFLNVVEGNDYETAHGMLSSELRSKCPIEQMAGQARFGGFQPLEDSRITLEETKVFDSTATVTVRVTTFSSSELFGSSESSRFESYSLRKDADGQWRFTGYPFPVYGCPYLEPEEGPRPAPSEPATPEATPPPEPAQR